MRWPFVSRSKFDDLHARYQLALTQAGNARGRAETAVFNRQQIGAQLAEEQAANKRLEGRLTELRRRGGSEDTEELQARIRHLEKQLADQTQTAVSDDDPKAIAWWRECATEHDGWKPPAIRSRSADSEPLFEGGWPRPTHPALVLQRALERCRALEARLAAAEGRKTTVSPS